MNADVSSPPILVPLPPEQQQLIDRLETDVETLAADLRAAQDAGIHHAIILPRLVSVFRRVFGDTPAGLPTFPQIFGQANE